MSLYRTIVADPPWPYETLGEGPLAVESNASAQFLDVAAERGGIGEALRDDDDR